MTRNATVRVTQIAECFFSICAMCDWISVESADVGVESYSLFASRATYGLLTLVVAFLNFTQAGSDRFDFFYTTPQVLFAAHLQLLLIR